MAFVMHHAAQSLFSLCMSNIKLNMWCSSTEYRGEMTINRDVSMVFNREIVLAYPDLQST